MRPPRSFICASICASTMAGLATAPPKTPECRSLFDPAHVDLEIGEPAQRVADRRHAAVEHRRIGDHDDVGGEILAMVADELVEMLAADFLLALDEELDVARQAAGLLQVRLDGLDVHEHLALVVGRAARIDLAVAHGRFERRRRPQVDRVDRLHVVVAVEENRRLAGRVEPVAVDDRVSRRLDEADVLHPGCAKASAVHSAVRRTSAACSGSALMLGIARYCFSSST